MYEQSAQIKSIVEQAQQIVIVQADNPDGDSLGSALALEHILGDMGKNPYMYCGVDMPAYLHYLEGWDRVQKELPKQIDASIIVDASTMTLLERLTETGQQGWLATKPCVILDHHEKTDNLVPFATVILNDWKKSSTGELIYHLSKDVGWDVSLQAQEYIMTAILGDTQGLTNQLASADTYQVMTDMIRAGIDRPRIEELRREYGKMQQEIFKYKGRLIERAEFTAEGSIVTVVIPQEEISTLSPLYNPGPLVQNDMLQTQGVKVAIVFKHYADGKVTGAIRCNSGYGIAGDLAEHLGGGGHAYASGFKITNGKPFQDIKADCISFATELLAKLVP